MRVPEEAPTLDAIVQKGVFRSDRFPSLFGAVGSATADRYFHWDDLRFRKPPMDASREEWWAALKFSRTSLYKLVALTDKAGNLFRFCVPDLAQRRLHFIDQNLSGQIVFSE